VARKTARDECEWAWSVEANAVGLTSVLHRRQLF